MSDTGMVPYSDLTKMAESVVKSGMFPNVKTTEAAMTLFLICQSEGLHPLQAMMRYNIIQGRPAMKAEAMLASFMERGGTVDWTEYTNDAVSAIFTSRGVPSGVTVRWTMEDAKRAGILANPTWTKYPKQMLKARVASDGVRMADPTVNQGRYTPEEVSDFEPRVVATEVEIMPQKPPQELPGASAGGDAEGIAPPEGVAANSDQGPPALISPTVVKGTAGAASRKAPARGTATPVATTPGPPNPADPERCPYCLEEGHDAPIGLYFSEQEAHKGEAYEQCSWAHGERERLVAKGKTPQEAQMAVSRHWRKWAKAVAT